MIPVQGSKLAILCGLEQFSEALVRGMLPGGSQGGKSGIETSGRGLFVFPIPLKMRGENSLFFAADKVHVSAGYRGELLAF